MRRKSEHRGLFSGLTFSSAMILFGVMLAAGAIVGLVVSGVGSREARVAQQKNTPPQIRAVHIKPDITQVKRETPGVSAEKKLLMSPAMLRQMSQLEQRLGTLEKQIRSLSKSNLDLAEKVDTSGLDNRLEALEDSLQNFTASIDKRIKENERRAKEMNQELPAMKETELTPSERNLLPPPFKTDTPQETKLKQKETEPIEQQKPDPVQQKKLMEKAAELAKPKPAKMPALPAEPELSAFKKEASMADLTKPPLPKKAATPKAATPKAETAKTDMTGGKTGWEPVVTYHNVPKTRVAAATPKKPRFTTRQSSPEVTGSVNTKRASPAPAKKKIAKKPFAVHIGSASTLYQIKDNWLTLQRDNGILRSLRPHIVSAGESKKAGAVPWKLLAGPVASEDEAARICTRLNAKGNFCRRTTLSGHPLKF